MKITKLQNAYLLTLSVFAALICGVAAQVTDANVEEAIRDSINKANGDLTDADLARVTTLDLSGRGLTSVRFPDGMVNLETLDLSNNDLRPSIFSPTNLPADLESITTIDLSGNAFPNLGLISDFTTLETVIATNNTFDKLTIPGTLTNLVEIDLRNNGMSEVTFEEGLESLVTVNISKNALTSLDSLSTLTAIEILDASENDFTKLTMPEIFTLKELNLDDCELQSFVINEGFTNLEIISIRRNELAGSIFSGPVSFANDLGSLRELNLRDNSLTSFTVPAGLTSLELLSIEDNNLSRLEFAGPLPSVIDIIAFDNKLKTLTLPEGLANLETLELFNNELTEFIILPGFPTDPEPNIDIFFGNDDLTMITLPEGAPDDLITVFLRFVDEDQIIFIPLPLPTLSGEVDTDTGNFELSIQGSLGTYNVFRSTDLSSWNNVDTVVNETGVVIYTQAINENNPLGFFRIDRVPEVEEE